MTPAAILSILALVEEPSQVARAEPSPEPSVPSQVARLRTDPNLTVAAVHGLALMTGMRVAEAILWPDPFARPSGFGAHYEEAFTKPPVFDPRKPAFQWDGDPVVINVVGHGLFGSELYLRARQCRFGWAGSLAFAAATSALWEYGIEGSGTRPSAEDLVYTPLAGALLGELRFAAHQAAASLPRPAGIVVRSLVDPLGELERAAGTDC